MNFQYIDIHSHLHFDSYDEDREGVIERMREEGAGTISIGIDPETSKREVEIAEGNENIWASIGIHPGDSQERFEDHLETFEKLADSEKVVCIGECGFDYFRLDEADAEEVKKLQAENFEAQIDFAARHDLPIMIHCRNSSRQSTDAVRDILDMLESKKREYGDALRGNAHFFVESTDIAKRYLGLDFTLSFTGVITFARDYDEAVKYAPLEKIHGETDAPFVAPAPLRGKRNEPAFVKHVYEKIADIRGEDKEMVRRQLIENAKTFFKL